jgi:hypothetical protein
MELFTSSGVITCKEHAMKKTLPLSLSIIILVLSACSSAVNATQTGLPGTQPASIPATQSPLPPTATQTQALAAGNPTAASTAGDQTYSNEEFGLSFTYPAGWFGPSEYVSDKTLRVEVGSDTVYPYGEVPEQPSSVKNSYSVVVQYTQNNQNPFWQDTYQSLQNMKDGESLAGTRSLLIRVRQFALDRFSGFEYIATLPETAQTEAVYTRDIMLVDQANGDILTVMGQPVNVELSNAVDWRAAYQAIDQANLPAFQGIVSSLTVR